MFRVLGLRVSIRFTGHYRTTIETLIVTLLNRSPTTSEAANDSGLRV